VSARRRGYAAISDPDTSTPEGERTLKRFFTDLVARRRGRTEARRERALRQAAAERERGEPHDGTIWRSGKGGSHIG
jgi:hypothetical protein